MASRGIVAVVSVAAMVMALVFVIAMIVMDFPIIMVFVPIMPFAVFAFFGISVLRKSKTDYDSWWNSLSEYERADIEQDFSNAEKVDPILILGDRYAFIRQTRIPLRYEDITDIYFARGTRNQWRMIVSTSDGKKHIAYLAFLSNRTIIEEEFMNRCGVDVISNYGSDFVNWI